MLSRSHTPCVLNKVFVTKSDSQTETRRKSKNNRAGETLGDETFGPRFVQCVMQIRTGNRAG